MFMDIGKKKVKASNELVYGKHQVASLMHYVKELRTIYPETKASAFLSDGVASQFKNKIFLF